MFSPLFKVLSPRRKEAKSKVQKVISKRHSMAQLASLQREALFANCLLI